MGEADFILPQLHSFLKLYRAPDATGTPAWTLHNPVSNAYYRLNWAEFECLMRFASCKTAYALKEAVETQTTLKVDLTDIKLLIEFLIKNGLVDLKDQAGKIPVAALPRMWERLLHGYLYFTIPLFRPEKFLDLTLPYVAPFLSKTFTFVMACLLCLGVVFTLQRFDEFIHTFTGLFSLEGLMQILLTFVFIKIVHEMAHAYTARKHGIPVPHMGVALIVMYPVLYTETTGSWQLPSRKSRFEIGIAGIRAELCVAAVALLLWNILPANSTGQSLCFTLVAVSLVSSLLVNLNPLMRFDGYYMMSDLTGIENLQNRACNFARWKLRKILFGLSDEPPEHIDESLQIFLTGFGIVLLVYRFFLFSGIALLVYHVFFKPLGLILMLVELGFFIFMPVLSELKVWWKRRHDIIKLRRGFVTASMISILLVFLALPIHTSVTLPAVVHARKAQGFYPPADSKIESVQVHEGQLVKAGDILILLSSETLERDYNLAVQKLGQLETRYRQAQTTSDTSQLQNVVTEEELSTARLKIIGLQTQRDRLKITADFQGTIRDLDSLLTPGQFVSSSRLLMRVVDDSEAVYSGYSNESDLDKIEPGREAIFIPDHSPFTKVSLRVKTVSTSDADQIVWPLLASVYGGSIKSDLKGQEPVPLQPVYDIEFEPLSQAGGGADQVLRGQIRVDTAPYSQLVSFINSLGGLIRRESGLN